jgi:Fe-S-cluster containining protein
MHRVDNMKTSKCVQCGKCCSMIKHQPFLTAIDVQGWINKGLWHIIKELRFTTGKTDGKPRQEWTFQQDKYGNCLFLGNGKCLIYRVRPLVCQVYPTNTMGTCENGTNSKHASKAISKQFLHAIANWNKSNDGWRQDKLEELIKECEKRGLKSKYRQETRPVSEQVTNPSIEK